MRAGEAENESGRRRLRGTTWSKAERFGTIEAMPASPQQQHGSDGLKLADVLDRLAGALEQQARTLIELKGDVGNLMATLKGVETRLGALEHKRSTAPDPATPKASPKKRPK